jgi:glycosyltransferase involved in cell wall biosynthesis
MGKKVVSIIVPAHNQQKTIKQDLENIHKVMSQTRWSFEIIVVVDGSKDKTFDEAKKAVGENIKIFGYENNKGKGYAVRYGMARAKGEYISFIDAGMDINPNGISMLLEYMEWYSADIIVGSKRHPGSKVNYPFIRKVYSFVYYLLIKFLFGLCLKDTQTGLKVFKRNVLEKVMPRLLVKQFAFDIEILAVADHLGFKKIYEAPVEVNFDFRGSHISYALIFDKNVQGIIRDTLAVWYRLRILKYYDDSCNRKWVYDEDLNMRINTGELGNA